MSLPRVLTETVFTFSEAAASCPVIGGKRPSVKTVYFWADTGIKVGAARVKLECAKFGGNRVTSAEAIERFVAATTAGEPAPAVDRTPAARRKESDRAMQFLRDEFAKV